MSVVDCQANPDAGADTSALLIATMPGRDAGTSALVHGLNRLPGVAVRGGAGANGWMHLAEFAQRWIGIRRKMEVPTDPDYAYFSQFRRSPKDGFAASAPHSDFRSLDELLRRKIKPAWFHFFNLSHVLCNVRQLVIHMHNPRQRETFGFVHMFQTSALAPSGDGGAEADDPTLKQYPASSALRSMEIFLRLFPKRGRVLINMPLTPLPDPRLQRPRCICAELSGGGGGGGGGGDAGTCAQRSWPDQRVGLMQRLVQFTADRPQQALLLSPQRWATADDSGATELLRFLGQPTSHSAELGRAFLAGSRAFLSARLRRDGERNATGLEATAAGVEAFVAAARPVDVCQGSLVHSAAGTQPEGPVVAADPWCVQSGCARAAAGQRVSCRSCPAGLVDLSWGAGAGMRALAAGGGGSAGSKAGAGGKGGGKSSKGGGGKAMKLGAKQGSKAKQGGSKLKHGSKGSRMGTKSARTGRAAASSRV